MSAARLPQHGTAQLMLSARQLEVLALVARGLSTDGIAGELFVSSNTVRTHVRNILFVLDAQNRAHAVAIACATGLIATDEYAIPEVRGRARTTTRRRRPVKRARPSSDDRRGQTTAEPRRNPDQEEIR
jgi:DNA-binding CsgD family transcriptional regulator